MKRTITPWTDKRGLPLSNEVLKIRSQSWDKATWSEYLKSLEVKASGQLFEATHYQDICDEAGHNIFSKVITEDDNELSARVQSALEILEKRSLKQALIIREIFWNGKSLRQLAKTFKLQHNAIFKLKIRAINNLKLIMKDLQGVDTWQPYEETQFLATTVTYRMNHE